VGRLNGIAIPGFLGLALCLSLCTSDAYAQLTGIPEQINDGNKTTMLPVFFVRDSTVGSPYLARNWSLGTLELADHHRIPEGGQPLWLNFDKVNDRLLVADKEGKQWSYSIDSISSFDMMINGDLRSFEKIPWINHRFFLIPLYRSDKGYSLYKRLITRCVRAEYLDAGYYTVGKKYDEYVDSYEYYLTYPGNTSYRKLTLKESLIRRALKEESGLLEEYFKMNDQEMNEQNLIGIIQYVDDKKYPE